MNIEIVTDQYSGRIDSSLPAWSRVGKSVIVDGKLIYREEPVNMEPGFSIQMRVLWIHEAMRRAMKALKIMRINKGILPLTAEELERAVDWVKRHPEAMIEHKERPCEEPNRYRWTKVPPIDEAPYFLREIRVNIKANPKAKFMGFRKVGTTAWEGVIRTPTRELTIRGSSNPKPHHLINC